MKKLLTWLLILTAFLSAWFAIEFMTDDFIAIDVPVDSTVFAWWSEINVNATIDGDAFLAGQNIMLSADVTEDAWFAANSIIINGSVQDDLRAAWNTISISAPVVGDAMIAGNTLSLNANVWGDVYAWGRILNLNGEIAWDLNFDGDILKLWSAGKVLGNARISPDAIVPDNFSAQVVGEISYSESELVWWIARESDDKKHWKERGFHFNFFRFLSLIILWALAFWFMPNYISKASNTIKQKPGKTLLSGLWILAITPFAAMILLATGVGASLGWWILANYIFFWVFLGLFAVIFFADWIVDAWAHRFIGSSIRAKIAVMVLLSLILTLLPYAISVILWLFGLWAGWLNDKKIIQENR